MGIRRYIVLICLFFLSWADEDAVCGEKVATWLARFQPGVHVLDYIPTPNQILPKTMPRGVPRAGALGSWQGAAFGETTYTFGLGGHDDGYFDGLVRVDFLTGAALVSKASPLTRPRSYELNGGGRQAMMLPQRDDYVTRHIAGGIIETAPGLLYVMGYSGAGANGYEMAAGLPNAWVMDFNRLDKDGYIYRRPTAYQPFNTGKGWTADSSPVTAMRLPNGDVFWAAVSRWMITRGEKLQFGGSDNIGWSATYLPGRNAILGITYKGALRELKLSPDYTRVVSARTVLPATSRWRYASSIAPWSDHKAIIFTGAGENYIINPDKGAATAIRNTVFQEPALPNRSFNRFHQLSDGAYLYVPTDMDSHPVLWIVR